MTTTSEIYEPWKVSKPEHTSGNERPVKKRVRTGCFNCRRKHKKCDEEKPVCKACTLRKETCEWPNLQERTRKQNRQNEPAHSSLVVEEKPQERKGITIKVTNTPQVDEKALETYTKNLENIDSLLNRNPRCTSDHSQTEWVSPKALDSGLTPSTLAMLNGDGTSTYEHHHQIIHRQNSIVSSSISPGSTSAATSNNNKNGSNLNGVNSDTHSSHDFQFIMSPTMVGEFEMNDEVLKSTLRDYMFANATNFESNPAIFNSHSMSDVEVISNASNDDSISFLTKPEEKFLLKNYLYNVAPWLDMFDLSRQMGLKTVQLAKKSPSLRYAILALSAKQVEKTDTTYDTNKSSILYQHALKHLIPSVKESPNIGAISACVILCVLDMMSISPEKWRYHLEGCSALFKATGINGFSDQYERALFWVFARMDVNSAVIGEQSTMIECAKWLPDGVSIYEASAIFKKDDSYEMFANYMVFLCSRVVNLVSAEVENFEKEWELLWNEVNQWHKDRQDVMKPLLEFEACPFPEVLYDNGPAISGNQLYHMAMILLMENKPRLFKINPKIYKPPTWHAKQICSISIHNDHHGCWNNSVQTLWIAGRLLTHDHEHRIILDLLNRIESTTGWEMKFRAKDLIEFWEQS